MAGRDNPYDMQIKLLMIGDSGMLQHIVALFLQIFLFTLIPLSSLLQVLVKHVYSFVMLMTHFLQHSLQPLELTLKLRISKSMGQESSSRLTTQLFESNIVSRFGTLPDKSDFEQLQLLIFVELKGSYWFMTSLIAKPFHRFVTGLHKFKW
jgi:hypothetical protein